MKAARRYELSRRNSARATGETRRGGRSDNLPGVPTRCGDNRNRICHRRRDRSHRLRIPSAVVAIPPPVFAQPGVVRPKRNSLPGAVVPGSARSERRDANPPAAALLTGQAVRELAPARTRLCLVCSLFGGAPLPWAHGGVPRRHFSAIPAVTILIPRPMRLAWTVR